MIAMTTWECASNITHHYTEVYMAWGVTQKTLVIYCGRLEGISIFYACGRMLIQVGVTGGLEEDAGVVSSSPKGEYVWGSGSISWSRSRWTWIMGFGQDFGSVRNISIFDGFKPVRIVV